MNAKIITLICFFSFLVACSDYYSRPLQGYIEGEYTSLASNYPGKLTHLYVQRGQQVRQGQPIFDLDEEPERSQIKKAQADLDAAKARLKDSMSGQRSTVLEGIMAQREQAQAALELAKNNFLRSQQLYQKGVIDKQSYESTLSTYQSSQHRVDELEANLKEAQLGERQYRILAQNEEVLSQTATLSELQWRLSQKHVVAPEAGLIYDTFFNEGEQIAANQAVASLLPPRYIRVIFYIPEPLRSLLELGEEIKFTCDGCSESYLAKINYISPQAEYTPPVIFSRESRSKLVFRVQAELLSRSKPIYPGQPVEVYMRRTSKTPMHRSIRYIFSPLEVTSWP